MKKLINVAAEKLHKCPYQVAVYGETNCEVIYRSSYKGDWGHWDEDPKNDQENTQGITLSENKKKIVTTGHTASNK